MAITMRQPFDPRGKFVAKRSFKFQGHGFSTGDNFPHNRLAIDVRTLHRLFNTGFIHMKGDDISLVDAPEVDEVLEDEELIDEETSEEEETVDEAVGQDFIFDPEVHVLDHPDKGQWLIMKGGETVLRVNRKEWKRLEKKSKAVDVNMDCVISED